MSRIAYPFPIPFGFKHTRVDTIFENLQLVFEGGKAHLLVTWRPRNMRFNSQYHETSLERFYSIKNNLDRISNILEDYTSKILGDFKIDRNDLACVFKRDETSARVYLPEWPFHCVYEHEMKTFVYQVFADFITEKELECKTLGI